MFYEKCSPSMEPHVSARMQLLTGECCHFRAGFGYADRVVLNSRSSFKTKVFALEFRCAVVRIR